MRFRLFSLWLFLSVLTPLQAEDTFDAALADGRAQLQAGQYHLALTRFEAARALARQPDQRSQAAGWLGFTQFRMHRSEAALTHLSEALAASSGAPGDRARWLAASAELLADEGDTDTAKQQFREALTMAAGDPELTTAVRLGQAALLDPAERSAALQAIRSELPTRLQPSDRARYLVNIATQARTLGPAGVELAYASFEEAGRIADSSPRVKAEALGGLAQIFEERGQTEAALRIDWEGVRVADSVGARDLLLELEWRRGRLLRRLQRNAEALAAYQRALEHIEAIRSDIPVEYHDGRSSFRETLEPVYLGLADLLLLQAETLGAGDSSQLLRRARETVELIKQTELEDFLGGRCAVQAAKTAKLEAVEPKTAVLYPIILPERLELLISTGTELRHFVAPVSAETLQTTARALASALRNNQSKALALSQTLFNWLIRPTETWLRDRQVQTLVVVPDGVLRLIPLAALHDGQRYLIERYAVATSPGLTLFEPTPLRQRGVNALLAGMSKPGPVLEHLPPAFVAELAQEPGDRPARGLGPAKSRALPTSRASGLKRSDGRYLELQQQLRDPAFIKLIREDLSLPGVDREIDRVRSQVTNKVLLNDSFTVSGFKQEVLGHPYSVVHIASHGVFGSSAASSFVMAYDGVLNIDDLEKLLKAEKFQRQPLELLTLSACQTAEGDDRAPLGISGIALKARVRSALGTLWPVNDDAAAMLMAEFYTGLGSSGLGKVEALRQAQLRVLGESAFAHPFFWAPFVLVGNWL